MYIRYWFTQHFFFTKINKAPPAKKRFQSIADIKVYSILGTPGMHGVLQMVHMLKEMK